MFRNSYNMVSKLTTLRTCTCIQLYISNMVFSNKPQHEKLHVWIQEKTPNIGKTLSMSYLHMFHIGELNMVSGELKPNPYLILVTWPLHCLLANINDQTTSLSCISGLVALENSIINVLHDFEINYMILHGRRLWVTALLSLKSTFLWECALL